MEPQKIALVVRGGWDGHQPVETTDLFIPYLQAQGFAVTIAEDTALYADADFMANVDLVLQCVTMGEIKAAEVAGLRAAVAAGTGLAGWHGGVVDSFRNNAEYLQLVGAQFAAHPGKHVSERRGDGTDGFAHHTINFRPEAAEHPITEGLGDFSLHTEQYWVLADDYNDVLATTTVAVKDGDPWRRPVTSPAVWTRSWGAGKVFVATPGHTVADLQDETVKTLVERGLLWATR